MYGTLNSFHDPYFSYFDIFSPILTFTSGTEIKETANLASYRAP